jgi:hypothetical protein
LLITTRYRQFAWTRRLRIPAPPFPRRKPRRVIVEENGRGPISFVAVEYMQPTAEWKLLRRPEVDDVVRVWIATHQALVAYVISGEAGDITG